MMMTVSCARPRRRSRRAPVVLVLTIGFLAIISTSTSKSTRMTMCLAFNTMTPAISSINRKTATATKTTRLYNGGSYDDQYAQFSNPNNDVDDDTTNNNNEVAETAAVEDYDISSDNTMMASTTNTATEEHDTPPPAAASPGFGPGFGSYLESLGDSPATNGAVVEQQQEQVYYEATNSYEAPAQPEVEEVHVVEENKYPFTALASTSAIEEEVKKEWTPSSFSPPLQYDSSPTLSAESPTISVTLPVGLRPPKLGPAKDISYGENSRKFRRTVYTHEDWVRHRSPDRFFRYIASVPTSGIYKNLARELVLLTAITTVVVFYNGLITGYQDINGIAHGPVWSNPFLPPLTLPMQPFALASPSLGLLLGKLFFLSFNSCFCSGPYYSMVLFCFFFA
jgi:hypothetical protein